MVRLILLGVWGTLLTTGWMAFSPLMGQAQLGTTLAELLHVSTATVQVSFLLAMGSSAYGVACWSVGRQRHGGDAAIAWPRLRLFTARTTVGKRFNSARAAQFWFEWRRNGVVLPVIVGVILLLVVAPFFLIVPFTGRAAGTAVLMPLGGILALPFALAFFIGLGFGKTNFWGAGLGKGLGVPLFLAVRPMTASDWISVKMKTAAWSAVTTWLIVATVVPLWLLTCCDFGPIPASVVVLWQVTPVSTLVPAILIPAALLLLLAMLATWRLLVANLYLGVFGSTHLSVAVGCSYFLAVGLPMALAGWYGEHQDEVKHWSVLLEWLPWLLGILVAAKLSLALHCVLRAIRRGLISATEAWAYFLLWIYGTGILLLVVWLMPIDAMPQRILAVLALLALPLFRISVLPLAVARGRVQ
jgi:hypothetical protein